jgi:hypothetical protein
MLSRPSMPTVQADDHSVVSSIQGVVSNNIRWRNHSVAPAMPWLRRLSEDPILVALTAGGWSPGVPPHSDQTSVLRPRTVSAAGARREHGGPHHETTASPLLWLIGGRGR